MKKISALVLAIIISFTFVFPCSAQNNKEIGNLYLSETTAFIDCCQIPVYVYNGYPYVIAEDLNGYGFDIRWSQSENTLYLNYNQDKHFFPYEEITNVVVNEYAGKVYSDNVIVKLNGEVIPSYSLNGRMLVSLDELWRFGEVNWYAESNTLGVTTRKFINNNPDWKTLLPTYYFVSKVVYKLDLVLKIHQKWIDDSIDIWETYGYYKPTHFSWNEYNKVCIAETQLQEMFDYIKNDSNFYERGNLYHLLYNSIDYTKHVQKFYKNYNGCILDNMDQYAFPEQVTDEITSRINIIAGNVLPYIDR